MMELQNVFLAMEELDAALANVVIITRQNWNIMRNEEKEEEKLKDGKRKKRQRRIIEA